ncbi:MAG: signal peptide peptidase SppA [Phycisphaerae bacterium]
MREIHMHNSAGILRRYGVSLLVMLAVAAPAAAQDADTTQPSTQQQVAHMRLAGEVLDSPPGFVLWASPESSYTLRNWLHRLAEARQDDSVAAVALELDSPLMSWAQARELADAVERLAEVKPVHCYLSDAQTTSYLVASAGTELAMDPIGTLMLTGVDAEVFFYRGTLDLLGVEPQFIQAGRFKGAAEPLTDTEPSEQMREVFNWILDDLYAQLCGQISAQRGMEVRQVEDVIDRGPFTALEARRERLVDSLVTRMDWQDHVESIVSEAPGELLWVEDYGAPAEKDMDFSNPFALLRMLMEGPSEEPIRDPTVAIVHIDGMIVPGRSGDGLFGQSMVGARTITDVFEQIRQDDRIKAVVLRVNSPGGSAMASEHIYQAVRRCAREKPVIASIGAVGASGGYYVSLGAGKIVADPPAIVGSIGVVGGKLAITGLLDKIGVNAVQFSRGQNAGMWSSRAWTEEETERVRSMIQRTYNVFVRRVVDSRGAKIEDIDAVAQGRIFTSRQAVENGLIDELGGMREAVVAAQEAAGLDKSYFVTLPKPRTLMDLMQGGGVSAPRRPGVSVDATALLQLGVRRSPEVAYLLNLLLRLDRETELTALPYHIRLSP